ncbi:hypothetical protein BDV96DRAFT_650180 [Lophiotrema nucula]|uniref:Protein kinase domain-containing protein n=1 Tax=Lophiotrema nucula TaxID=690887 RepID=A0A6A5YY97_9PLEO|nr:hypothetical protein BDV96DRAFT_650180 [Lophiotrema nucula]
MDNYPNNANSTSAPTPTSMAAVGASYASESQIAGIERHPIQSALPMAFNGTPTTSTMTSSLGCSLRNDTIGTTSSAPTSFAEPTALAVIPWLPTDRRGKRRQDELILDESSKRVKESAPKKTSVDAQASDIIISWILGNPAIAPTPSHPHLEALEAITRVEYKAINHWIHERFGHQNANGNDVAMNSDEVLRAWAKHHPQGVPDPEILDAFSTLGRTDFRTIYRWFHAYSQGNEPRAPDLDVLPASTQVDAPDLLLDQAPSQAAVPYNGNELVAMSNIARLQDAALAAALEKDCTASKSTAEVAANMQSPWDPNKRFPCVLGCGHTCDNKSEFIRHEICYAQETWICNLPEFIQSGAGERVCTSQKCMLHDEHDWATEHEGHVSCSMKPLQAGRCGRIFFRADHLKQHNRIHHHQLGLSNEYVNSCTYSLKNDSFPRRCGFCGYTWASYQDRVDHLEEHFKNGRGLDTWQDPWLDPDSEANDDSDDDNNHDGNDSDGDNNDNDRGGDAKEFDDSHFNSFMDNFDPYYDLGGDGSREAGSESSDFFRYGFYSAALGLLDAISRFHSGLGPPPTHEKDSSPAIAAAWKQLEASQMQGSFWALVKMKGYNRFAVTTLYPMAFRLLELTGVGATSVVNKVSIGDSTRSVLAIKHTRLGGSPQDVRAQVTSFIRDYFVMSTMRHPHVLKAYGLSLESSRLGILMPAAETDMQKVFDQGPLTRATRPLLDRAFGCLASALSHIHEQGVHHHDIKPANILIRKGSVMLCDFGISRLEYRRDIGVPQLSYRGNAFTRKYAAPERIYGLGHSNDHTKWDVWSLGCVYLEILGFLNGHPVIELNHSPSSIEHERLLLKLRELRGHTVSQNELTIVQAMRSTSPTKRPSAPELARLFPSFDCCGIRDHPPSRIEELLRNMMDTQSSENIKIAVLDIGLTIEEEDRAKVGSRPHRKDDAVHDQAQTNISPLDRSDALTTSLLYRDLHSAPKTDLYSNATTRVQRWIEAQESSSQAPASDLTSSVTPGRSDTHKRFFCSCCVGLGRVGGFQTKYDWKRHMENCHENITEPSPRAPKLTMLSPTRYAYRSLQPVRREIRLLQLLPSEDFDARLHGRIEHVSLDDKDHRPYEALSYVWGDPEARDEIYIADSLVRTTKNLGLALRHLRRSIEPRILWIDAVCINQEDNMEKGSQIRQMTSIYSSAQRVVAWLGESDQSLCCPWQSCKGHGKSETLEKWAERCDHAKPLRWYHEMVNNILGRPWFKRLWTVQEAVLAPSLTFVLGSQDLSNMCDELHEDESSSDGGSKVHFLHGTVRDFLFGSRSGSKLGSTRSAVHDWLSVTAFLRQRREELRLLELLERFRGYQATDDRDKVYAIIGLLSLKDRQRLVLDYSMSTADLYSSVARSIITQSGSLEVLSYAAKDRDGPGSLKMLPSWVPDWTQRRTIPTIWSHQFDAAQLSSQLCIFGQDTTRWTAYALWDDPDVLTGEFQEDQLDDNSQHTRLRLTSILVDTLIDDLYPLCKGSGNRVALDSFRMSSRARAICLGKDIVTNLKHWTESKGHVKQTRYKLGIRAMLKAWACAGLTLAPDGTWARVETSSDLDPSTLTNDSVSPSMEAYLISVTMRSGQRKAFVTGDGFFGIGPASAHHGDIVAVFPGGRVPFVLRKAASGQYRLIGECYVHGLMDGEALGLGRAFTEVVIV